MYTPSCHHERRGMYKAKDLLRDLEKRGITLWLDGGEIRYRALQGRMSPDDLRELRSHKDLIYKALAVDTIESKKRGASQLSVQQEWYWQQMSGDLTWNFFAPTALRLVGEFRADLLRKSIEAALRRHEALRSKVTGSADRRVVEVADVSDKHCVIADLRHLPEAERENEARSLVTATLGQRLDISVGPLFVGKLFLLSDTQSILLVAVHHLVVDGISLSLFFEQVWVGYRDLTCGLRPSLPAVGRQYSDYVGWQQQELDAAALGADDYWAERLKNSEPIRWRKHFRPGKATIDQTKQMHFSFGSQLSDGLRQMAARYRIPLSMIVFSAMFIVISRRCCQSDFVFPLLSSGRQNVVDLDVVGLFVYLVPLRVCVEERACFLDFVRSLTSTFVEDCEHGDFGYRIVKEPALRRSAVAQWISWQDGLFDGRPHPEILKECGENLVVEKYPFVVPVPEDGRLETDFSVTFKDCPDGVFVEALYGTDVFSPTEMDGFWADVRKSCACIGQDSFTENTPIQDIHLCP
jgi:Condensation domain/TubC N-terminal docking domain